MMFPRGRLLAAAFVAAIAMPLGAQSAATDNFRPQLHFSPAKNWTNDPNGLVYFDGEYHLFFQYNPFGDQWGHMSWGHAVSRDLVHWTELPVAIPEQGDEMVFTGSVVIDEHNTSRFCTGGKPCMVAVYTAHNKTAAQQHQAQALAYSNDHGRTWTRYAANPVLDLHMADFRDPDVFRDEATHRWIMAVALPNDHIVRFYSSPDLKRWTRLSDFTAADAGPEAQSKYQWECPTLIALHDGAKTMYALKVGVNPGAPGGGSGEQYFLGSFDGTRFTRSHDPRSFGWTNQGHDDYCAIAFNNVPGRDPMLLGWMSNWDYSALVPTSPWRGQMSLARTVTLVHDADGLALAQTPVLPLQQPVKPKSLALEAGKTVVAAHVDVPQKISMDAGQSLHGKLQLRLRTSDTTWTDVVLDGTAGTLTLDRSHSGTILNAVYASPTTAKLAPHRRMDLTLVLDRNSVELFAQDGTLTMTDLILAPSNRVSVELTSDVATQVSFAAQPLK